MYGTTIGLRLKITEILVGRDTSKPMRSEKPCKPLHGAGCGQRTENPLPLGMGSVKNPVIFTFSSICNMVKKANQNAL